MSALSKEVDRLLRTLQTPKYGCRVTSGHSSHWRVHREGHRSITISMSPSDRNVMQRILRDVRNHLGIDLTAR